MLSSADGLCEYWIWSWRLEFAFDREGIDLPTMTGNEDREQSLCFLGASCGVKLDSNTDVVCFGGFKSISYEYGQNCGMELDHGGDCGMISFSRSYSDFFSPSLLRVIDTDSQ